MNIEEDDVAASLKRHASALGCVHVCENHRGVPGTGHLDWQAILRALKESGYNGYLSIESFVEAGTPVGDGLNIRISRSTDPLGEMGRGIAFMKKCMEQV